MAKILIVDDDQDFVSAVTLILESAGYDVEVAHTRQEGLVAFDVYKPDLVLLDVMMQDPDDGFVLAQDMKKQDSNIPIVMLTSVGKVTGMSFDKDSEMVPVDDFEQKPIMPNRLLAKVKEHLFK
ncbi:MAG: response regulator [Candidatus Marinimicrobia bacterium CG08_land_8_20_14_0_20_45_22]|nr:MAG: response regulator [Candidatus Marinimicrobia bacterium CG08_land_8_20_14_0_20_45_22]